MVSMKVSIYSITPFSGISFTLSALKRYCSKVFNMMMPMKPKANYGMVIFLFSLDVLFPFCLSLFNTNPMTTKTGASIMTRIIFVIVAVPAMPRVSVGSMALPAPATCATSCNVLPVYIAISVLLRASNMPVRYMTGYKNMDSVPKITTVDTAMAVL